jgi:hypothetical protein
MFSNFTDVITLICILVLLIMLKEYIQAYIKNKNKKGDINKNIISVAQEGEMTNNYLDSLLQKYNADRVYIMQFHNGGSYYSGKDMQKITINHEVTANGVSPKLHFFQSIPITTLASFINDALKDQALYKNKQEMSGITLKHHAERYGIQSMIGVPLYKNNMLIAILGLDWVKMCAPNFCEDDPDSYNKLKQELSDLVNYL